MATVLKNFIIFTANENKQVLRQGTLVFDKGLITAIGPMEAITTPPGADVIDGQGKMALLPGFVDAHSHSSLLRGFSENLNLMEWLPVYQREPYTRYLEKSIGMGLGTDGPISNNSLSMWELMKFSSLQQKVLHYDAALLPALDCLRLATIGGARLLREDRMIGSLEIGKHADLMSVNLWQAHLMPLQDDGDHDPVPWNLVYSARASDVHDVWVQGERLIHKGRSTRVDEDMILQQVHKQTADLLQRRRASKTVGMI